MFTECTLHIPQKIYLRIYGTGPVIVLFHPSPNSSKMMHSFATVLAKHYTVICPDTPGYGNSDALPINDPTMEDYVNSFHATFAELGIKQFSIYGSATGGQLAIRYGLKCADQIEHLFLDNCAHFTDEERTEILKHYFPNLTPQSNGSHLLKLWEMVTHLFKYFPWCFQDEAHQLHVPMPPIELLHGIAMDYLRAGPGYDIAYKAAFNHEKVDYIQELNVPTTILRWEGSILKKYTDRIFEYELQPNIEQHFISANRESRFTEISDVIQSKYTLENEYDKHDYARFVIDEVNSSGQKEVFSNKPPSPEISGKYLIKAWSALQDATKNTSDNDLSKISQELIRWYS